MGTGTYGINGTDFNLQPSEHRWVGRDLIDMTGDAHPVYPAIRTYELRWGLMTPSEYKQVEDFYLSVKTTGTCVIDLPKFGDTNYTFFPYSGCTLQEPAFNGYYTEHLTDVVLLVENIRT